MSSICILGRQPAIGLAELESLYGSNMISPAGDEAAMVALPPENIEFARLGGTIKLCRFLTSLPTTKWQDIHDYLAEAIPQYLQYLPEGKLQFGISTYGLDVSPRQLQSSGLTLKKIIKGLGRSVRLIPNQEPALNSAQVLHNHLTGKTGWELVVVKDGSQSLLAQTVAVQDITAYAARDQARPKRDARVGMLPPKLAQVIINLAVTNAGSLTGCVVLDPFCGTGVILQEATLMGFDIYGSDADQRMVEYTDQNLQWLLKLPQNPVTPLSADKRYCNLEQGDATIHQWRPMPNFIASETYLGRPFSALPAPDVLSKVIQDVNTIHRKFLQNVAGQTSAGFRMCIAIPAWKTKYDFKHLPFLDHLEELGYTRLSFTNARNQDLIYHRPNQIVARELVVLQRN